MTLNAPSHRKRPIVPVAIIALGCALFISWIIAMHVAGTIVDEQKIDPSRTPVPLIWFGAIVGPLIALYGYRLLRKAKG